MNNSSNSSKVIHIVQYSNLKLTQEYNDEFIYTHSYASTHRSEAQFTHTSTQNTDNYLS